ncbi:hypothetical protein CC86DRAFT_82439 [Ophiobolus disseminans]|uniref:Uncharacterized protein n=1 Tax=Ophiobolus disseminans TaxID=1469910 RepID=A0A6A7AF64_9PLEO|nr:hypothetical protein CC86DRAFT_82439 [Ophiobolus disseminans]
MKRKWQPPLAKHSQTSKHARSDCCLLGYHITHFCMLAISKHHKEEEGRERGGRLIYGLEWRNANRPANRDGDALAVGAAIRPGGVHEARRDGGERVVEDVGAVEAGRVEAAARALGWADALVVAEVLEGGWGLVWDFGMERMWEGDARWLIQRERRTKRSWRWWKIGLTLWRVVADVKVLDREEKKEVDGLEYIPGAESHVAGKRGGLEAVCMLSTVSSAQKTHLDITLIRLNKEFRHRRTT